MLLVFLVLLVLALSSERALEEHKRESMDCTWSLRLWAEAMPKSGNDVRLSITNQ